MPAKPLLSRHLTIALSVVLLHVGLIWALQSGLLIRAAEILIPAEVLSEWVDPPAPIQPKKPQPAAPQPPIKSPEPIKKTPPPVPAPVQPLAVTAPAVQATVATVATAPTLAAPVAPAKSAAPVQAPPAPPAPAAVATVVQQPSSNADYLQNPKPPYPSLSARMGETGKTVYKVWIDIDGKPQRAELVSSSGFPRLDKAAYDTVMSWRYVPGKRNGVPEAMAFNVPIHWELRN